MNKKEELIYSVQKYLSLFGNADKKILNAIKKIDRKFFVKEKDKAYLDSALQIGNMQTISQPSTVARMLEILKLKKGEKVLEIGTGSGWNASLISLLVFPGKVLSLENSDELINFSKKNIKKVGIDNLKILKEDFRKLEGIFDKIIFTAGIKKFQEEEILKFAKTNLKNKGILVCPNINGPLIIIKKVKGKLKKSYTSEEYLFVPLIL